MRIEEPRTVGDYVTLQRGSTYKGDLVGHPGPPLLGLGSIEPGGGFRRGHFKTFGGECPAKWMVPPGALYVALKGATKDGSMVGSVARLPHDLPAGRLTQDTARLDFVDPRPEVAQYLYWILRTPDYRYYCAGRVTGSASASFSREDFLAYPVPPLTDRTAAIIQMLESLEEKLEQNRRTGRALEELARATFKAWFVDFEPVKAKAAGATRFPGMPPETFAALPDRVVDCPLGQVPDGWEITTLEGATTTIETGKRPKGGVGGYSSGVPSIGAESITRIGEYDFGKTKYVPEAFFEAMKKGVLSDGDVLLYKDGGRPGDFQPHVSMVGRGFPFDRMCINEHVFRIRARSPLTQSYLYLWLSSEPTMEEMRRRGTGVAIPGLSAVAAKQIATLVPTESVVKAFENIAQPLLSLCLQHAAESSKLATLRDYLLPRLLTGRVRVCEAERAMEEVA